MHFNVKCASVLILLISEYLSNECDLMEMQIGLRTPHGRNIFDLNTSMKYIITLSSHPYHLS